MNMHDSGDYKQTYHDATLQVAPQPSVISLEGNQSKLYGVIYNWLSASTPVSSAQFKYLAVQWSRSIADL